MCLLGIVPRWTLFLLLSVIIFDLEMADLFCKVSYWNDWCSWIYFFNFNLWDRCRYSFLFFAVNWIKFSLFSLFFFLWYFGIYVSLYLLRVWYSIWNAYLPYQNLQLVNIIILLLRIKLSSPILILLLSDSVQLILEQCRGVGMLTPVQSKIRI